MSEKQKIITFGVPESFYNRINDTALSSGKKVSELMKEFTNKYFDFINDPFTLKAMLAFPREKVEDKNYMKAWFKQKSDYLVDYFYNKHQQENLPHNTPTAHEGYE